MSIEKRISLVLISTCAIHPSHSIKCLEDKVDSIFDRPAIFVLPVIRPIMQELIRQISKRRMELCEKIPSD